VVVYYRRVVDVVGCGVDCRIVLLLHTRDFLDNCVDGDYGVLYWRVNERGRVDKVMYKWSEMKPRERDALVAKHVMIAIPEKSEYGIYVNDAGNPISYDGWRIGNTWYMHIPFYTTDISAAWEVVEKMVADGWEPHIDYDVNHSGIWEVCFGHMSFDAEYHIGKSITEEICLAALRAVGVDVAL
jgi:hypothetical protein